MTIHIWALSVLGEDATIALSGSIDHTHALVITTRCPLRKQLNVRHDYFGIRDSRHLSAEDMAAR